MGSEVQEIDRVNGSSSALARKALLSTCLLALAGSALGVLGLFRGLLVGPEAVLVLSGGIFIGSFLLVLLFFPRVKLQWLAWISTCYYTLYLCAGMVIAITGAGAVFRLPVYLVWFFPLLVFNKLVNVRGIGRQLTWVIFSAPLLVLALLLIPQLGRRFSEELLYIALASGMSYACYGLMLHLVTRYRDARLLEQERAELQRVESEVLESISDCFISLDSEFRLIYMNDAACSEFGVERKTAMNRRIPNAVPGFFSASVLGGMREACRQMSATTFEAENEKLGLWYEMRCFPRPDGMSVYFRNITGVVLSRRRLEAAHNRLRQQSELLDKAQDAIFVQDMDTRFLYWNKGAERMFGWSSAEVMGRCVGDIFHQSREEVRDAFLSVVHLGEWTGEMTKLHRDGRSLIVESRCTLLLGKDGRPTSILAINTDITDRKAADARIHNLAYYDVLTGLPNRALLRERLQEMIAGSYPHGSMGAVLLIDLDDFKTLNDTSGHHIGDLLLQEVARRVISCVRKTDSVARFGGDEFVVILEGLSSNPALSVIEARSVAEKILVACREPYRLDGCEYDGTTSIGVTLFQGDQDSVDDLLKRVDLAMYRAKAQGRNTLCFFDPDMETSASSRAALLADLRRAMQNDEFELHYQPQMDSAGCVIGAEALLRWRHPQRGMVSPGEFIPLAESAGLIVELGYWVLETACAQLAEWAVLPRMAKLDLAVNVSIRQFLDSRFVQLVEKVLRESGANPRRLKLEITESFMMEKAHDTIAKMAVLKAQGVGFSMDDFGTGYSSLSQLKRLPLDQLKIDQSFVRDVLNGVRDASIVHTIITLGQSLNLSVIAEGVETEEQREFLEEHGCLAYQGFLFSPAVPPARFEAFVEGLGKLELNEQGVA